MDPFNILICMAFFGVFFVTLIIICCGTLTTVCPGLFATPKKEARSATCSGNNIGITGLNGINGPAGESTSPYTEALGERAPPSYKEAIMLNREGIS